MSKTIANLEAIEDGAGLEIRQKIELARQYKLKPIYDSQSIPLQLVSEDIDKMLDRFAEYTLMGQIRIILYLEKAL